MTTDQRRREQLAEKGDRIAELEARVAAARVMLEGWRQEALAGQRIAASIGELSELDAALGPGGAR